MSSESAEVAGPERVETAMRRAPLALPSLPITVRPATQADLPFIDALQKTQTKAVGWMPRQQLEGKIRLGQVLVAEGKVDSGKMLVDSEEGGADGGRTADARSSLSAIHSQPSTLPPLSSINCSLSTPLGYLIGHDQYFKRDDVGIIYQINVTPGRRRGLIGATLLRAQFERSAWGCRLYCCWCAQDLEANRFWEAMGFVPLAFRTGSRTRGIAQSTRIADLRLPICDLGEGAEEADGTGSSNRKSKPAHRKSSARIHIFWQKRIRAGDTGDVSRGGTPWWFPSQTSGGSIREDRLVLPIPPGVRWSDAMPALLPKDEPGDGSGELREGKAMNSSASSCEVKALPLSKAQRREERGTKAREQQRARIAAGGLRFVVAAPVEAKSVAKAERPKRSAVKEKEKVKKNDPTMVSAARELRDRWLEQVNAGDAHGVALPRAKYEVTREIAGAMTGHAVDAIALEQTPRLLVA